MSKQEKQQKVPSYPCAIFEVIRKVGTGVEGHTEEKQELATLRLDTSWGTMDHIMHYSRKPGFNLVSVHNLDLSNEEHAKIDAFARSLKAGVEAAVARAGIRAKAKEKGVEV